MYSYSSGKLRRSTVAVCRPVCSIGGRAAGMAIVELGSDGSAVRGAYASVYPCRNLGADLRWGPSGSDTAYKGILNF